MNKEHVQAIVDTLRKCWEFECGEECPWYDWSPDEGFHCQRYKGFEITEQFFKEAIQGIELRNIIKNNITHIIPEVIDGFLSGNSYIGMTTEDLEKVIKLVKEDHRD